jgi:hypothetical protein
MNRDEVKAEVAEIIRKTLDGVAPRVCLDIAEEILSLLDGIGYDAYPEIMENLARAAANTVDGSGMYVQGYLAGKKE